MLITKLNKTLIQSPKDWIFFCNFASEFNSHTAGPSHNFNNPGDAGAVFMSAAEISAQLVSYGNIRKPLAINKLSTLLQKSGYEPRRTRTKRGYIVYVIKDLDEQRKLDARAAFEKESMRDAGDTSDTVF